MKLTAWGTQGLLASTEGLGAMGMSAYYGDRDERESVATLNRALDLGVTMIDTAEAYGPFLNEQLIGRAIGKRREEFAVATKFGRRFDDDGNAGPPDGSPTYARTALERSLRNLGMDTIDLYYLHRIDPDVPVEETVGAMSDFVTEGKIRYLGLSEASPETLRRAHATHPITALQTEYSLVERSPEANGVLETTRELGIAFVAYSPLGRGFLTGSLKSASDLPENDARRFLPRFDEHNLAHNLAVVDAVQALAAAKGVTVGQLALAWVLHQEDVVAIPGTKRRTYLEENVAAAAIELSEDDLDTLAASAPIGAVQGDRYDPAGMRQVHL